MLIELGVDEFSCRRDTYYNIPIIGLISCRRRSVVVFYCTVDQLSVDKLSGRGVVGRRAVTTPNLILTVPLPFVP